MHFCDLQVLIQSFKYPDNSIFSTGSEDLSYFAANDNVLAKLFVTFPRLFIYWNSQYKRGTPFDQLLYVLCI